MKKILILNSKGGVGKSTLSIAIADILQNSQLVDTDHQGSLKTASEITGRHKVVSLEQANADFVILDTAPYLNEELPGLINACDVMLIPTMVGSYDLLALSGCVEMIRRAKRTSSALIVFNAIKRPVTKTFLKTKGFFFSNYKDIKKAKVELSYLMAYHTLPERKIWGKAKKEVENLVAEIFNS